MQVIKLLSTFILMQQRAQWCTRPQACLHTGTRQSFHTEYERLKHDCMLGQITYLPHVDGNLAALTDDGR